jgi:hypothetical protein
MARKGKSPLFARLASEASLPKLVSASERVHKLFDLAFSLLKREGCRAEYIYKAAITHNILLGTHSLHTAAMLNEFRVGPCKADIAILNGTATVYEVKSERDSLTRLERQVDAYLKVFARVYVISAESHVASVLESVPEDVGVMVLNSRQHITKVREAEDRPERTSAAAIFDAIRTNEARLILRSKGIAIPDVPNTEISSALRKLFAKLDPRDAQQGMVDVLKRTRNLLPLTSLIDQLPPSLHTAALSVSLRKADHTRLVDAVNTRVGEAMAWA